MRHHLRPMLLSLLLLLPAAVGGLEAAPAPVVTRTDLGALPYCCGAGFAIAVAINDTSQIAGTSSLFFFENQHAVAAR